MHRHRHLHRHLRPDAGALRRRLVVPTAALFTTAALLSSCGSSTQVQATSQPRGQSATGSVSAPAAELLSDAAERSSTRSLSMATTMRSETREFANVDARTNADGTQVAVRTDLGGLGSFEVRIVDGAYYVQLPSGGGSDWLSAELGEAAEPFAAALGELAAQDPRAPFDALRDISSEVDEVGREDVDGVPTTRYRLDLDVAELLGGATLPGGAPQQGTTELDVWVDDEGFLRRMNYELSDPAAGGLVVDVVIDYDDVTVEAPPADAVTSFDEKLRMDPGAFAELFEGMLGGD